MSLRHLTDALTPIRFADDVENRSRRMTTVERAIQLARDGSCLSVSDVKRTLNRERYDGVEQHLNGSSIKKQLVALIAERRRPVEG